IAWKAERLPKRLPKKLVQLSCVVIGLNDFHFDWFRHLLSRRTLSIIVGAQATYDECFSSVLFGKRDAKVFANLASKVINDFCMTWDRRSSILRSIHPP
ncbi:MAG: hypothetical protein PHQ24_12325, partial [Proteiniphilum sp.]|nr:hypothetical protein [Proteiniphilum sp.]